MTVIAFDGKMVAADKRATSPGVMRTVTKIFRNGPDEIVCVSASGTGISFARAFIADGRPIKEFPTDVNDMPPCFAVVQRDGTVLSYDGSPYPTVIESGGRYANGAGREYALAAMYLGCDARRAVEIANTLSPDCGGGIDVLRFE